MMKKTSHPSKQAKLLADMIDKKIEAKVAPLERSLAKMLRLIKALKATSPKRVAAIENEINSIKELLDEFNVKSLEEDVFRQFNKLNKKITASLQEQRASIEAAKAEASTLKSPGLQENITQDMEALKTKTQWLEIEMEKFNLGALMERIDELEARLDAFKLSSPMIIE